MSKIFRRGRIAASGWRWQSRHHPMVNGAACRIRGMRSTRAMTGGAADAFRDVNAVVEVNVIGKDMNSLPVNRLVGGEAFSNRRKHRRIGPKLRMTGHASFGGRNARKTRSRHRGVAIAAVQPQAADMVRMAEWHRLLSGNRLISYVGRSHQSITQTNE